MRSRNGAPPERFEIRIEKVVYGGWGLGRHQGKVVIVPFSVPGDYLKVRVIENKKSFLRAVMVEVIEPGPGRVPPPCPHFGVCGGCQWQSLEYPRQVEAKRQLLEQMFGHSFPETRRLPIEMMASPQAYGYRSRARIQIRGLGPNAQAGFFRFQSHLVEDVKTCPLFRPALNDALASVRLSLVRSALNPGIRQLALACSTGSGAWGIADMASDLDEGISAMDGAAEESDETVLEKRVGEFTYSTAPEVFFQANDFMVEELLDTVRRLAARAGNSAALDLFCGVGFFTLALGRQFREVQAVEFSPRAWRLCSLNARNAGLENVHVACAGVGKWVEAIGSVASPAYDLILLDPPRSGAGLKVMEKIREWAPETVIYVSCDPQTLLRDLEVLVARDYAIDFIRGLDLFPQSFHFETVVRLKRLPIGI